VCGELVKRRAGSKDVLKNYMEHYGLVSHLLQFERRPIWVVSVRTLAGGGSTDFSLIIRTILAIRFV
jgi:hypothetical protein